MPTYVYRREDGTTFEIEQPITADALEVCPTTGQPVRRLIRGSAGLIFKGDGFYLTDYVRKGKSEPSGEGKAATPAASSEKPAPPPTPPAASKD